MSREIRFRAWDGEIMFTPEMDCYFELAESGLILHALEQCFETGSGEAVEQHKYVEQPQAVIMQYTGLTDKNGVKIFEGDVIHWDGSIIGAVEFQHAEYIVGTGKNARALCASRPETLEVVGNKFQNPELLQEQDGE